MAKATCDIPKICSNSGSVLCSASSMIQTPAAVGALNNVATEIYIDTPRGCCVRVSVKNISAQAINVQNANLIVERIA